jgi:hypothetical protein
MKSILFFVSSTSISRLRRFLKWNNLTRFMASETNKARLRQTSSSNNYLQQAVQLRCIYAKYFMEEGHIP